VASNNSYRLPNSFLEWWREQSRAKGLRAATSLLLRELWDFIRDSTPERSRSRYGDMDYDWQLHVNTTSGGVRWRERLLGVFHSAYQPTDEAAFRDMMAALPIDFPQFTFIDVGSGKGRVLLMASNYPFHKIIGVELMPELHHFALENIALYHASQTIPEPNYVARLSQLQDRIESICLDARQFPFPETPLVLYLFNPLPESSLRQLVRNLEHSYSQSPRPIWIVYYNPVLEHVLIESSSLHKVRENPGYSIFQFSYP